MGGTGRITGITALGDPLRPHPDGTPGGADGQARWLHDAIRRPIGQACALPVDLLAAGAPGELRDWLRGLRRPEEAHAYWARSHASLRNSPFLEAVLAEALTGRFVVGCALPPGLLDLMDELGIPHLDLRVHPVRFTDDLLLAARASELATQAALLRRAVPEGEVIAAASRREAELRSRHRARRDGASLLVVGQARHDPGLIFAGAFFDPAVALPDVERVLGLHSSILLRRRPGGEASALPDLVRRLRRDAEPVAGDVHALLARPDVAAVLTVNGSVAVEAGYFGKEAHVLAPPPVRIAWRGSAAPGVATGAYASVDDWLLTADCWREVLSPHAAVTAPDGARPAPEPNRLRVALAAWNDGDLDAGPASGPPPAPPRGLLARASSNLLRCLT